MMQIWKRSYRWTMANELMVLSNPHTGIAFGGGGGFGLQLDDELDNGMSNPCATFGNKRLSSSEFFKTLNVEVWRLDVSLHGGMPQRRRHQQQQYDDARHQQQQHQHHYGHHGSHVGGTSFHSDGGGGEMVQRRSSSVGAASAASSASSSSSSSLSTSVNSLSRFQSSPMAPFIPTATTNDSVTDTAVAAATAGSISAAHAVANDEDDDFNDV